MAKENETAVKNRAEYTEQPAGDPPEYSELVYKGGDSPMTIKVRVALTFEERAMMTEYIANFPFIGGEYVPYMQDMGRYTYVFTFYTDLDVEAMSAEEVYRLSQDEDLLKSIYQITDDDIGAIFADAEKMIEWRKQRILHKSADQLYASMAELVHHLDMMLSKVGSDFNPAKGGISMQQLIDAMNGVTAKDEKTLAHNVLDFQEAKKKMETQKPKRRRASTSKKSSSTAM